MRHFWGITCLLLLVSARPAAAAHHELPDLLSLPHTQMNPAHLKTQKNRRKRPAGKRTLPDRRIPSVGRPSAFPLHTPFVAK